MGVREGTGRRGRQEESRRGKSGGGVATHLLDARDQLAVVVLQRRSFRHCKKSCALCPAVVLCVGGCAAKCSASLCPSLSRRSRRNDNIQRVRIDTATAPLCSYGCSGGPHHRLAPPVRGAAYRSPRISHLVSATGGREHSKMWRDGVFASGGLATHDRRHRYTQGYHRVSLAPNREGGLGHQARERTT